MQREAEMGVTQPQASGAWPPAEVEVACAVLPPKPLQRALPGRRPGPGLLDTKGQRVHF